MAGGLIAEADAGFFAGRRRLAVARHRVVLAIHPDGWASPVGPLGAKGGGHAGGTFLHAKALCSQQCNIPCRRLILPPRWLTETEDVRRPLREITMDRIDEFNG